MGQIRVVLIFNEDNERQKEIGEYLKSQKRCKTALITELIYAWLHKENGAVSSYNNANISVEELKQQLLQDKGFLQQIRESVNIEVDSEEIQQEEKEDDLAIDIQELLFLLNSDKGEEWVIGNFKLKLMKYYRSIEAWKEATDKLE